MDKIKNHAKLMAEMIPPLSSAAGGMESEAVRDAAESQVFNMNDNSFKSVLLWPTSRPGKSPKQCDSKRWLHGDYKDAPFLLTHNLYRKIANAIEGKND